MSAADPQLSLVHESMAVRHYHPMGSSTRMFATAYAVIVGVAVLWAWYTDVRLFHSPREHLLPDIFLAFVSLPASKTLDPLFDRWPALLQIPFLPLALLTACAAFQVGLAFFLCLIAPKARNPG